MIYFNLYRCCELTEGYNQSILIDFERNLYCEISKKQSAILVSLLNEGTNDSLKSNKDINKLVIFLIQNKFIYLSSERIPIYLINKDEYHTPFNIEDVLVDYGGTQLLTQTINQCNFIGIESFQLRISDALEKSELLDILKILNDLDCQCIELILSKNKYINREFYIQLYKSIKFLTKIVITDCEVSNILFEGELLFTTSKFLSEKSCGIISKSLFQPNLRTILKSKKYNTCLEKKVSINNEGDIMNCPSMEEVYGNIQFDSLDKIINTEKFKKLWKIKKYDIDICKDCEYRLICTDCRAYLDDPNDIYSKPLKCGYNPYTNKWSEWKSDINKKEVIEYYKLENF